MQIIKNILSGKAGPSLVLSGTPREIQAAVVPRPMTNNPMVSFTSPALLFQQEAVARDMGQPCKISPLRRSQTLTACKKMGRMLLSSPVFHESGQMEKGKARGRQESIFLMQILPSSFTVFSKQA